MKRIISLLITAAIVISALPSAASAVELTEKIWEFSNETGVSTDAEALDIPVIKNPEQFDSTVEAIKSYSGNDVQIVLSTPVEISIDDKVTVEADIAYSKESGGKYLGYSISSSTGNGDLLNSYLSAYSSTEDTTLKLGGIEKLTQNSSGVYNRPQSIYNPSSAADTSKGWTYYKAVYDYNAQLMTLTISSAKGTNEYTSPLSYATDIKTIRFISNNSSGKPCYVDNVKITEETSDIPYIPGEKVMSIVKEATGASTGIDTSSLYRDSHVSAFAVTTADADGNLVLQEKVAADTSITVNTAGAVRAEVVPVFRYENIGSLSEEKTLKTDVENGLYHFTFKKSGTKRTDIYVNGSMVANNVDKDGYNRKVSSGAQISVGDVVINDGSVRVSMTDTSDYSMSWCEFNRESTIVNRKKKVYIIGDSLVSNYYGSTSNVNKGQAGWGEVIEHYFTDDVEVVNLANGGHYATILETTAFPGVMANAQSGDYLIIECGYNDTKYNDADTTRQSVERMVNAAKEKGMTAIVVSPNASIHECDGMAQYLPCTNDYTDDVHFAAAMEQAAKHTGAYYVNLSKESYDFYYKNYGDDKETIKNTYYFPEEPDFLHHNYLGAMNCARIVAQGMYDNGIMDFINTDYTFTFTDAANKEITYQINTAKVPSLRKLKGSVKSEGSIYQIYADAGALKGQMIAAAYDGGTLNSMATVPYDGNEVTLQIETKDEIDHIKLMLWNDFASMNPLCEVLEIPKNEWESGTIVTPPPIENEAEVVSLAGEWGLKLGSYADEITANDVCSLPGTLSENEKGTKNNSTDKTRLSLKYKYTGAAVYQKIVDIPAEWANKSVTLTMERTKNTRVWFNGIEQTNYSTNDSLAAPHDYYLTGIKPGEKNTIAVEVTNGNYDLFRVKTHMLTEETQTDWNGIIGEIALKATDNIYVKDVMIYPDAVNKTAKVKAVIQKDIEDAIDGTLTLSASSYNHEGESDQVAPKTERISLPKGKGETIAEYQYNMGDDVKLWSEFHPSLYQMVISLDMENGAKNDYSEAFGMRDFSTSEGQFTINGKKTFLRGEANSAVFPLTGYPFMTKGEWKTFFAKAQSMGINFFRFHSWTPPMAAFEAADEMGIYMQPEMYGFGGTPTGFDTLYGIEGERILAYLASNPSFVMMTFGNEMTTNTAETQAEIEAFRKRLKEFDATRLYAEGTNNNLSVSKVNPNDDFWTTAKVGMERGDQQIRLSFAWNNSADGGRLEGEQPNSCQDFNKAMEYLDSDIPVMGHETGQYQVYPNFKKEIPKYENGIFAPRNLSNFQSIMEKKGLTNMNETFSKVTARTSAIQYRADIEAALKTTGFGGYQLLSIQDFPGQNTALVGILDSFMDDKDGGFTSDEYKSFNSPVVALARIPKYMYNASDFFNAEAVMTNYSEDDITSVSASWSIAHEDGTVIKEGELPAATVKQGGVTTLGTISEEGIFASISKAEKLVFTVSAAGNTNSYSIWVYPVQTMDEPEDVLVADAYTKEVRDTLEAGGKVLMLPTPNETNLPNSVSVRWTNDYWSSMFHGRVAGAATTMGLYVDETHPVFADFPTEFFGDYQWYNLMKHSRAVILDDAPESLTPMAQNIDHMAYSRKLGSIFEAKVGEGKLLVCTMDILNQMNDYPEVRQMYNSLVAYAQSEQFHPQTELTADYLRTIFKQVINSEGDVSAYEAIGGFDYSWANTKGELKSQTGTDSLGNQITNAVGGISAGDVIGFDNVRFDGNGASKISISAANGSSEKALVEMFLDSVNGRKITEFEFDATGGWDKFQTHEFEIPHLWKAQNIVLKFTNANICLDSIRFIEDSQKYRDPYTVIDPSNTSAGAVEFTSLGGRHETEQLTVKIDGAVKAELPNCDFGFSGAKRLLLGGSIINSDKELTVHIVYMQDNVEQKIPVTFKMGEGEEYTVTSGTTGEYTFYRNTIELPHMVKGVQNIAIEFPEETLFEFSDISFIDESTITRLWDFKEYTTEVKTSESGFIEEYNGLKIAIANNGNDSDHDKITTSGVYWRGGASDGESARYIEYTPEFDGTLEVTGRIAKNDGRWGISQSKDVASMKADGSSATSASETTVSMPCKAGETYYIINKKRAAYITEIKFIP